MKNGRRRMASSLLPATIGGRTMRCHPAHNYYRQEIMTTGIIAFDAAMWRSQSSKYLCGIGRGTRNSLTICADEARA